MPRRPLDPPAIIAPAPDLAMAAVKAQAARPGCMNPNGTAWWVFDGVSLVPAQRQRRYRSYEDQVRGLEALKREVFP